MRYDTARGFAHRDLLNRHGEAQKTPLFNMDYNEALSFAESDAIYAQAGETKAKIGGFIKYLRST